jgi:ubiquinone/menaquinone biosynthesis C-methylase UbiE
MGETSTVTVEAIGQSARLVCPTADSALGPLRHSAQTALLTVLGSLVEGAHLLDVGCQGWRLIHEAQAIGRGDVQHAGCDYQVSGDTPTGVDFRMADLRCDPLPWADDSFDCVVLSHVLEHVPDATWAFGEAVRVCRPGGLIFIEAPSDRSLVFSFPWAQHLHLMLSYWDDPTHVGRPFTPQALYRMALYWSCLPVLVRYDQTLRDILLLPVRLVRAVWRRDPDAVVTAWWRAVGWTCYGLIRKPDETTGKPPMRYFSFKGVRARDIGWRAG